MANSLVALQGANPQINALQAFDQSQANELNAKSTRMAQARQGLEWVGSMALGAMGGKLDGQADPELWGQGLEMLAGSGVDKSVIEALRSRPDLAPTIARASLDTMQQISVANSDRDFELALKQFDLQVQNAAEARASRADARSRPIEINGQLVDPNTYEVVGDFRTEKTAETGTIPAGYRVTAEGNLEAIPGGPHDPANPLNAKKSGPQMNATIQKEIFEADEGVQSGGAVVDALTRAMELNNTAWDGPLAEQRGYAASLVGVKEGSDTLELKNLVTAQALDQLRSTFGAMPTEGERKILLEIQGSVDQPREVRARIFERAMEAAKRRLNAAKEKGQALRDGSYFDAEAEPAVPGGQTSSGLTWSIEP